MATNTVNIATNTNNIATNTNNIANHTIQIASLASGSPKGTYVTVSALTTAYPTGNSNIYIVTADGKWYYWNGSAWTAGGAYQSTGLADGSVIARTTNFMDCRNLYNLATATDGYMVNSDGNLFAWSSHSASDYIQVNPSANYVCNYDSNIGFYDSNKTFISGIFDMTTTHTRIFTTPSNCAYIRISIGNYTQTIKGNYQLESGSVATAYIPFVGQIKSINIPPLDATKASFLNSSINLFNKATATNSYMIDPTNGNMTSNTGHCASDWIPVLPSTTYTISNRNNIAFYTCDKVFISGINYCPDGNYTFTTPSNCVYMRFSLADFGAMPYTKDTSILLKGTEINSYVPYQGWSISSNALNAKEFLATDQYQFENMALNTKNNFVEILTESNNISTISKDLTTVDSLITDLGMFNNLKAHSVSGNTSVVGVSGTGCNLENGYYHLNAYGYVVGDWLQFNCLVSAKSAGFIYYGPWLHNNAGDVSVSTMNPEISYVSLNNGWYLMQYAHQLTQSDFDNDLYIHEIGFYQNVAVGTAFNFKFAYPTLFVAKTKINPFMFMQNKIRSLLNFNFSAPWNMKKWVAYGDSITAQNKWEPYVVSKLGLNCINKGQGGTRVADYTYPPELGTVYSFSADERINTFDIDADLVTIMGGTNDWDGSELGNLAYPYDTTKFKGALAETIRKIQVRCPNATIVVMSNVGGRGTTAGVNETSPSVNMLGLTPQDYANASKEVAEYLNVPFIDIYSCGINCFNRATYITDTVHPNDAGGKLIAKKVIGALKSIELLE